MLTRSLFVLCTATFAFAGCAAPVDESAQSTSDSLTAFPVSVISRICGQARVDAYRPNRTCADIVPASAGGTWQIDRLFPAQTDPRVHDHFCAYTWAPSATSCRSADFDALELDAYAAGRDRNVPRDEVVDVWKISGGCTGGKACEGESIRATPTVNGIPVCLDPSAPSCLRPGGGSCTTCGVVLADEAYMINPALEPAQVEFDKRAGEVDPTTFLKTGGALFTKGQSVFDLAPSHTVFVAKLPQAAPPGVVTLYYLD